MSGLCVIVLSACPPALKGAMSRWMLEVTPGVFVGRPNAKVRAYLWTSACELSGDGSATMVVPDNSDFGAKLYLHNSSARELIDFDGLELVAKIPRKVPGQEA